MEQYMFDKVNGIWYKLERDYYIPCVTTPDVEYTGIWGERRRRFLREHKQAIYTGMMLADALESHLQEINTSAERMFDQLVHTLAYDEGVSEQMKSDDPAEWIACMNNIRSRATELVNAQLIYT